jgi:signal transduction histidine kinase/CheY-like chemotaxis protein
MSSDELVQAELNALRERLQTVQALGRFGIWERDPVTLEGWWDPQMFVLWGLPPASQAPSREQAVQHMLPEDAQRSPILFAESLRAPGEYHNRLRLRAADGSVRHLLSQWCVRHDAHGRPLRVIGWMRDETEEVLRVRQQNEQMDRWRDAAALARITMWRHDLPSGRIYQSEQVKHVLGYSPPPEGLPIAQVRRHVHPDDLPILQEAMRRAEATGEPVDFETRYRNERTGQWLTVLSRRVVQRNEEGQPTAHMGVSLDITEVRAKERGVAQLRELMVQATDAAGVGHWTQVNRGTRAVWNAAMLEMHGLPADAPTPTYPEWVEGFIHPADRERVRQLVRDWLHTGSGPLKYETRIIRADGQTRQLQCHSMRTALAGTGQPPVAGAQDYLYFGLVIDVSERRTTEARRQAQADLARLAANGVGIGTWAFDVDRPHEPYWDEAMWRLRGLPPQQGALSADERLSLLHPDDVLPAQQIHQRSLREAGPLEWEFRVRWPDGQWRWLASRSSAVLDDQGRVVRRIGVNWDITQARHLASLQQERSRAVLESQAKSRFLARMSHELRTPLNAVIGFTQMLIEEGDATPALKRQRRLANILSAGQHLLSLINDVLDLSSVESGDVQFSLQPVRVDQAVQQAWALVQDQAAQRGLQWRAAVGADWVLADPVRLRQVLLNLLSNAVKYNRAGGEVALRSWVEGQSLMLEVRDGGEGLTPDQVQQLFQPFNRLGREGGEVGGTGIGLTIVKSLLERMQGSVEVSSEPGQGSRFVLRLRQAEAPTAPLDSDAPAPSELPLQAPAKGAARQCLLYIEDNPINAMIVSELLAPRRDIQVMLAATGEEGLRMALAQRPRLVLLDMQLPDTTGEAVFAALRADPRCAEVPVVALSANAMPADIERALAQGFSDYWTKPLDFRAFRAGIERLFGPPPPG